MINILRCFNSVLRKSTPELQKKFLSGNLGNGEKIVKAESSLCNSSTKSTHEFPARNYSFLGLENVFNKISLFDC